MGKAPAFQFYPGDWIQDTRILTPLTRGIWIDMLCFMWRSSDRGKIEGTPEQLARMLSCEIHEIETSVKELSVTKIADVTQCNDFVTVINRRMFREERVRKQTRCRVDRFRNAYVKRESNGLVTHASSSSSSSSNITPISPKGLNEYFEKFWKAYPKKIGKGAAEKAWRKIHSPSEILPRILSALEWQKKSEQWEKDHGQYIPNPATYLNQSRWEDEEPTLFKPTSDYDPDLGEIR